MVHPQEDRNDVLSQGREPQHEHEPERQASRLPLPGEIVGRKEPPYHATGLDALSPILTHVHFPATLEEIVAQIGEVQIPIDRLRTASVRDLLERVAPTHFASSREVELAFGKVFSERGIHQTRGGRQGQRDDVDGRPVS